MEPVRYDDSPGGGPLSFISREGTAFSALEKAGPVLESRCPRRPPWSPSVSSHWSRRGRAGDRRFGSGECESTRRVAVSARAPSGSRSVVRRDRARETVIGSAVATGCVLSSGG